MKEVKSIFSSLTKNQFQFFLTKSSVDCWNLWVDWLENIVFRQGHSQPWQFKTASAELIVFALHASSKICLIWKLWKHVCIRNFSEWGKSAWQSAARNRKAGVFGGSSSLAQESCARLLHRGNVFRPIWGWFCNKISLLFFGRTKSLTLIRDKCTKSPKTYHGNTIKF